MKQTSENITRMILYSNLTPFTYILFTEPLNTGNNVEIYNNVQSSLFYKTNLATLFNNTKWNGHLSDVIIHQVSLRICQSCKAGLLRLVWLLQHWRMCCPGYKVKSEAGCCFHPCLCVWAYLCVQNNSTRDCYQTWSEHFIGGYLQTSKVNGHQRHKYIFSINREII